MTIRGGTGTSDGFVGIGTVTPSQKLHVVGKALITDDVQLTGSNPRIDFNTNGASSLRFYDTTNAAERMRLDSVGDLTLKGGRIYVRESDDGNVAAAITRDADEGYLQLFSSGTQTVEFRGNGNSYFNGGNVGIGTTDPSSKLHIYGADNTSTKITLTNTAPSPDNQWSLHAGYNDQSLRFMGDSTTVMTLLDSGNVGIGTTSPNDVLHLSKANGTGDVSLIVQNHATTNGETASVEFRTTTSTSAYGKISVERIDGSNAFTKISTIGGGVLAERMRITSSGDVGIGTASPGYKLDVDGTVAADTYGFRSDSTAKWYYFDTFSGSNFIGRGSNAYTSLYDTGTLSMVWKNGNVGIGTDGPEGKLHIYTGNSGGSVNSSADELVIEAPATGGIQLLNGATASGYILFGDNGGNTRGQIRYLHTDDSMQLATAGSTRVAITSAGNFGIGTKVQIINYIP